LILYQDTDSICKLYLSDEEGIAETRQAAGEADVLAASLIAYAEVKGVFARARRARRIRSTRALEQASADFDADWQDYFVMAVSSELVLEAGRLAMEHALTGVDAIHLASAKSLRDRISDNIAFSTWDRTLARAAVTEGLYLAHEVNA
jgi:predicted nucleic acid-binding protein